MSESVLVARDGRIAVVTVNRPDKLNALNRDTIALLRARIEELASDAAVGAIVVTGAGEKAFVAGADIAELAEQGVLDGQANAHHGQGLTAAIETAPKPVLAAINGFALGGGLELALACDVRYASTNAKLGLPEVSLGIIPGYGGTQRLPRLVGAGKALEMVLTGDHISAEDALRIGLVQGVFQPGELLDQVKAVAGRMLKRGPTALALAKQAVRRGIHMPIADGLRLEADLFGMISSTEEMREGMRAFLEKRKPSW
ncbi:MAG: enoyl-CoA hydratase/isomerase family protein [Planctomycetes bacterium]|nr:enoyl-CoA hydratase/isomerase family protein [Planctomycetota bacterium]